MNLKIYKNKILWKVYLIWFFRRIVPLMILQVAAFALALKIFAKNVFVSRVLQNLAVVSEAGYWAVFKYLLTSFFSTHPVTQVVILIILGITALILRDIVRGILAYKSMGLRKG